MGLSPQAPLPYLTPTMPQMLPRTHPPRLPKPSRLPLSLWESLRSWRTWPPSSVKNLMLIPRIAKKRSVDVSNAWYNLAFVHHEIPVHPIWVWYCSDLKFSNSLSMFFLSNLITHVFLFPALAENTMLSAFNNLGCAVCSHQRHHPRMSLRSP
jgi:hypothetical protein